MAKSREKNMELAKLLFLQEEGITQKELAKRVGVTEKTIGRWIEKENWRALKRSMLTTRHNQLALMYDQLEWLNNHIATRKPIYDIPEYLLLPEKVDKPDGTTELRYPKFKQEDYPVKVGNVATSKEADSILKISASINRMEIETSLGETIEVARKFIEFIRPENLELAKQVTSYFDVYIQSIVK